MKFNILNIFKTIFFKNNINYIKEEDNIIYKEIETFTVKWIKPNAKFIISYLNGELNSLKWDKKFDTLKQKYKDAIEDKFGKYGIEYIEYIENTITLNKHFIQYIIKYDNEGE